VIYYGERPKSVLIKIFYSSSIANLSVHTFSKLNNPSCEAHHFYHTAFYLHPVFFV
jgi:hypothetical protein